MPGSSGELSPSESAPAMPAPRAASARKLASATISAILVLIPVRLGTHCRKARKFPTLPSQSTSGFQATRSPRRSQRHQPPPNKPLINECVMPAGRSVSAESDALVKLTSTNCERWAGVTFDDEEQDGLRARSEQAIGELAQALIDNPTLHNAISAAFGAREKAIEAQQAAMSALNLSSATDLERLERRLRSFSQRLEDVEEQLDQISRDLGAIRREAAKKRQRLTLDLSLRMPRRQPCRRPARRVSAPSSSRPFPSAALADHEDGRDGDSEADPTRQERSGLHVGAVAGLDRSRSAADMGGVEAGDRRLRGRRLPALAAGAPPGLGRGRPARRPYLPGRPRHGPRISPADRPARARGRGRCRCRPGSPGARPARPGRSSTRAALGPPIPVAWIVSSSPAGVRPV